eukprot:2272774-Pyramimonas_sp.AAC.1
MAASFRPDGGMIQAEMEASCAWSGDTRGAWVCCNGKLQGRMLAASAYVRVPRVVRVVSTRGARRCAAAPDIVQSFAEAAPPPAPGVRAPAAVGFGWRRRA